jgi:phosphate transporter
VDEGSSDEDTPATTRPGTAGDEVPPSPSGRRATDGAIYGGGGRPHVRRSSMVFMEEIPYSDYTVSDSRITLKKRTISAFVSLSELKSYVQLNWTGFSKALKKYDKTCNRNLRPHYLTERVEKEYPFLRETRESLNEKIGTVEEMYAAIVTDGDVVAAKAELKLHLREHVVWERNTVWRDMIGIERKAQAAALGIRASLLGRKKTQGDNEQETKELEISTPMGKLKLPRWCPSWLFSANMVTLLISLTVFLVLLLTPTFKSVEQSNCFAMLVFVSLLWATEVSPSNNQFNIGHSSLRYISISTHVMRTPPSFTNRR